MAFTCVDGSKITRYGCESDESCATADAGPPAVLESDAGSPEVDAGPARLELLVGDFGGPGNLDGFGDKARLSSPLDIAIDASGALFFTDSANQVIRKLAPDGLVTTFAGRTGSPGFSDGIGSSARFSNPSGLCFDDTGNLLVADTGNHIIRKISPQGRVSTLAGAAMMPGAVDGIGVVARFNSPSDVAVDKFGNVYVADSANHAIRKINKDGSVILVAGAFGMAGFVNGAATSARFSFPTHVTFWRSGFLVVSDASAAIRTIAVDGTVQVLAGDSATAGATDGSAAQARFGAYSDFSDGPNGTLWVADTSNHTIRSVGADGTVSTVAGLGGARGSADGLPGVARFFSPRGMATDAAGNRFVADASNHTIRKLSASGEVTTVAGKAVLKGRTDGFGAAARFSAAAGLAVTRSGTLLVADNMDIAGALRAVDSQANVTTFETTPAPDGGFPSVARISAIAMLNDGSPVWTEAGLCSLNIRAFRFSLLKRRAPNGTIETLAGATDAIGSDDGPGPQARMRCPGGVAVDSSGVIFVADTENHSIRRFGADGVLTTFAGLATMAGNSDGEAVSARFNFPRGLAFDTDGNLLVADSGNHTIRKITPAGQVSTLAGVAGVAGSDDGLGALARFSTPRDVRVGANGAIFVVDTGNHTIRKMTPAGEVTTVVGRAGFTGTVPGLLPASLGSPLSVAVLPNGHLAIAVASGVLVTAGPAP